MAAASCCWWRRSDGPPMLLVATVAAAPPLLLLAASRCWCRRSESAPPLLLLAASLRSQSAPPLLLLVATAAAVLVAAAALAQAPASGSCCWCLRCFPGSGPRTRRPPTPSPIRTRTGKVEAGAIDTAVGGSPPGSLETVQAPALQGRAAHHPAANPTILATTANTSHSIADPYVPGSLTA